MKALVKDKRAIFQIPPKSKSINPYETQLKCTLIYGLLINERENPVRFMFYGIYMVKHEQLCRNIQINENGSLWIKIYFCLYITEYTSFH